MVLHWGRRGGLLSITVIAATARLFTFCVAGEPTDDDQQVGKQLASKSVPSILTQHPFCGNDVYLYRYCLALAATKRFDEPTSAHGDVFWIQNFELVQFVKHTLPRIRHFFTLVLCSDLDINSPLFWDTDARGEFGGLFDALMRNPFLIHVFAENYDATLTEWKREGQEVVLPLPIGLDLHSGAGSDGNVEQHAALRSIVEKPSVPFSQRTRQIYVDANLKTSYPSHLARWDAMFGRNWSANTQHVTKRSEHSHELLKVYLVPDWRRKWMLRHWAIWNIEHSAADERELFFVDSARRTKYSGFAKRAEFAFALSLNGNGLDCHRTYESLLASNIVVVLSSPLDQMFRRYDLPVVIVDSLRDVNASMLEFWHARFKDKVYANSAATREKMTSGFWVQYIQMKSKSQLEKMIGRSQVETHPVTNKGVNWGSELRSVIAVRNSGQQFSAMKGRL